MNSDPPLNPSSNQASAPGKGQPPLHATGFIQGEQGTLIPVYQPDALNEYMNGSPSRVPIQTHTSLPLPFPGVQAQGAANTTNVGAQTWHTYPTHPQIYAYAMPQSLGNIVSSSSPPSGTNGVHGQSAQGTHPTAWSTLSQSPNGHSSRRPSHAPHTLAAQAVTHNQHHGVIPSYQDTNHATTHGGGLHHREPPGTTYHHNNHVNQHRREQNYHRGRYTYDFAARPHEPGLHSMNVGPDTQQSNVGTGFAHIQRQGPYPFQ